MATDLARIAEALARRLQDAWNAADGAAYAAVFAEDADFVNIRGEWIHGRAEIAAGHQMIFDTIYKGSHNEVEVAAVRPLRDGVLLAHLRATMTAPGGPLKGTNHALMTVVLTQVQGEWLATAFHNTLVLPPPPQG